MPCLNEAETLALCVTKALRCMRRLGVRGEVLVADNGSTDGSPEIAARLGARVIVVAEQGYGNALRAGIRAARGRFVIMGDADDSYDFTDLGPFLDELRQGCDLVMGNRFRGGIRRGAMPRLHRYLGNPALSGLGRLLFRSAPRDFHCGLRAVRREAAERMDLRSPGMEFATEMVVKATLLGMRVAEVPTTLSPDGRSRPPHLRSWRDGWRHLRFLLLYSPRWLLLYPGMALMVFGLAFGAWLLAGDTTRENEAILYGAAAVLLGFQAVAFSALANLYACSTGLRPADPMLSRPFPFGTLEGGLLVGVGLMLSGVVGSLLALLGDDSPAGTLATVVPALTALTLGAQIVLTSFLFGILGLGTDRRGAHP
jgi:hypothetical protein